MADDKNKPVDIHIKEDLTFGAHVVNQVPPQTGHPKKPLITQITGYVPKK